MRACQRTLAKSSEISAGQVVPPGVLEALDKVEGLDQRLILRRRAKREQVGQTEQFGPIRAIKAPHQGPIIIVVVGRDLLVACPAGLQRHHSAVKMSRTPWPKAALSSGVWIVSSMTSAKTASICSSSSRCCSCSSWRCFLAEVVVRRMRLRSISTNCVAGLDLGVIEETDEQTIASGLVMDVAHVADVEGRGFRGKLLHLGVGNLGEEGAGRQDGFQPREARRSTAASA